MRNSTSWLAVAAIAAIAAAPALAVTGNADQRAAAQRVAADVARLAGDEMEGRRAGTRGADRAAAFVAAQMKAIGLEPGDAGAFEQRFSFAAGVKEGSGNNLAVGTRVLKAGADFRPLAFSLKGESAAEAVFAGYGLVSDDRKRDDFAGAEVRGRIAIVLRYSPDGLDPHSQWGALATLRAKAAAAREKGATGILIVTGPRTSNAKDELISGQADIGDIDVGIPAMSVLRAAVEPLFAAAGTTLDGEQARADAAAGGTARRLGGTQVAMRGDVTPQHATGRNVIGILRVAGAAQTLVVGAHYDHLGTGAPGSLEPSPQGKIHHGADDNASGVAAVLELARRLSANRAALARNVVFVAFGGEELGLLGSAYFVRHPPLPLARVTAMVNLDMVGRLHEDTVDVHGMGTSPAWPGLVEPAAAAAGIKLREHQGGFGPSDHSSFYAAGKPVLFFFTGNHADYHRASDTAEKVNSDGIVRLLNVLEPVIRGAAKESTLVAFSAVSGDQQQPQGGATQGFKVWVGGIPDYSAPGPGVTFSGVSPGSPAEKAGVHGGDILVRFKGKDIRDIYEYTAALGDAKPGETVTLVLKRGGSELSLDLTLVERPSPGR